MAVTVTRSQYNIHGLPGGNPNPIIYFGPDVDLTSGSSQINASNTLRVTRYNESTGAEEEYIPGGGSNDFTVMNKGTAAGLGRGYTVFATSDFVLDYAYPA